MKMNIKPAFRYQFGSYMRSSGVFFIIMAAVLLVFLVSATYSGDGSSYFGFTGYVFSTSIFMFVIGIVNIRSDVRLCLQYGVSRRSSFVSNLLVLLLVSAILAVAGEVMTSIAKYSTAGNERLIVGDLYQLIYMQENLKGGLSLGQHFQSTLVNISLLICACIGGMFFSLMFWRLNKFWTVIVAVSIPVLMNIIPVGLFRLGVDLEPLLNWIISSPYNFVLFFMLTTIAFVGINWLLLRRADIKGIK